MENNIATYYTEKPPIVIREYGRYVQDLLLHARSIRDPELRSVYVERIVDLIVDTHPQSKGVEDYRLKVWSQVLQMANYELDVPIPPNVPAQPRQTKPERVAYPGNGIRYRYYGNHIQEWLELAMSMDPRSEECAELVQSIAAFMKMSFRAWTQNEMSDEQVAEELYHLSQGRLTLDAGVDLDFLGVYQPHAVQPRKRSKGARKNRSAGMEVQSSGASGNRNRGPKKNANPPTSSGQQQPMDGAGKRRRRRR